MLKLRVCGSWAGERASLTRSFVARRRSSTEVHCCSHYDERLKDNLWTWTFLAWIINISKSKVKEQNCQLKFTNFLKFHCTVHIIIFVGLAIISFGFYKIEIGILCSKVLWNTLNVTSDFKNWRKKLVLSPNLQTKKVGHFKNSYDLGSWCQVAHIFRCLIKIAFWFVCACKVFI